MNKYISRMMLRNAIAVQNIGRTQVGHIPRQIAAKLAPYMDASLITVEGTMDEGNCKFPDHYVIVYLL
jgi:HIRAN domain